MVKHHGADDQPTRGPRSRVGSEPQGAGAGVAGRRGESGEASPDRRIRRITCQKLPGRANKASCSHPLAPASPVAQKAAGQNAFLPTDMQAAAENAGHAASLMRHATSQAMIWGSGAAQEDARSRPVAAGDALSWPRPVRERVTQHHRRWRAWETRTSSDRQRGSPQPPPQRSYLAATNHPRNGQKDQKDQKDQKGGRAGLAHMNRRLPLASRLCQPALSSSHSSLSLLPPRSPSRSGFTAQV